MSSQQTPISADSVETRSGRISYTSAGSGPVALFVHGVVLNKHLWRHQLAGLSDIRRCIAVDLLAHGDTEIAPDQDVSVTANAKMLKEVLDDLKIDQVDLAGNDSGGGIQSATPPSCCDCSGPHPSFADAVPIRPRSAPCSLFRTGRVREL